MASVLTLALAWEHTNPSNLDPRMTGGQGSPKQTSLGLPKCVLLTKALAFLTNPKNNKSLDRRMARWQEVLATRATSMPLPI